VPSESRLIPRSVRPLIVEGFEDSRIVFVGGARQVGKTTLVSDIATNEHPMPAFTLDDQATRDAAAGDPVGFVADLPRPAFIDEIHRVPDLLLALKKAVDEDTAPGRSLTRSRLRTRGGELSALVATDGMDERLTRWIRARPSGVSPRGSRWEPAA